MFDKISYHISGVASMIGCALGYVYGELNTVLICLFGVITLDYVSGVLVACYEHKLSSSVGFKGLLKKMWILLMVGVAGLLDRSMNLDICRNMVCFFYICNEAISIIENGSKLGIPFPKKILKIITGKISELEEEKSEKEEDENAV